MSKVNLNAAPWRMHEFFAGTGLVAYGLQGMFAPVWANDISEQKFAVYDANFESEHFHLKDIKEIKGASIPEAHLSWASFPCQDLSLAGSMGGIHATRSGLVWEWLRILDELEIKPKMLLLENVLGLLATNNGANYKVLHEALTERGYKCGAMVINASAFIPQSRPRVFVLCVKSDCEIPSHLIGTGPCWLHNSAAKKIGSELSDWIWWNTSTPDKRQINLEDIVEQDVPFDKDYVLDLLPENHKRILDEADDLVATGYRRTRNGKQQLEMRADGIAGCLRTPEGGSSKQFVIVKHNGVAHARLMTVRETARLMGAPDDFVLPGSYNDGYKAMGDAVAMPVAHFLGERFLKPIAEAIYHD